MVANSLPYLWHKVALLSRTRPRLREVALERRAVAEVSGRDDIATTVGPWCCERRRGQARSLAKRRPQKVNCSASFAAEQLATRQAARRRLAYKGVGRSSYAGSEYEVNSNHHRQDGGGAAVAAQFARARRLLHGSSGVRPEDVKEAAQAARRE